MKKLPALVGIGLIAFIFCVGSTAEADLYSFDAIHEWEQSISNNNSGPSGIWYELPFPMSDFGTWWNPDPDERISAEYLDDVVFEYDDYVNDISSFVITLHGDDDNTNNVPTDVFLSFDAGASYTKIAQYDVPQNEEFYLSMDIKNGDLLYNWVDVGDLSNVSLGSFAEIDSFWMGYGCHFTHLSTDVSVSAAVATPEPTTLSLFGLGLIGLGALRKRRQ